MSDTHETQDTQEEFNVLIDDKEFNITIDDVLKLDVADGDALIVSLPEAANNMPVPQQQAFSKSVSEAFKDAFHDKQIKVVVVPHGMKVELLKVSELLDKE